VGRTAGWAVAAVGALVAAASVLGLLGSWWWPFDLLASFRPQYAASLGLVAAAALLLGRPATALGLGSLALVNLAALAPFLLGTGPAAASGDGLTVVSFNVGISNPARADVMRFVDREAPDLVFLYESSFEWEDAAVALGIPYRLVSVVPPGTLTGITIMARDGFDATPVATPLTASTAAAVEVEIGGTRATVIGTHPPSPTSGARSERRDRILDEVGRWVAGRTGPVLVVGDLNATPWSAGYRRLKDPGGLVDSLRGRGLQPSWPDGWGPLMITIDHALHTADLVSVERRTGPANGSAHRPLIVTVARSAAAG
jgi:endonuclease/exonuclease/phosphatase (EEP) superfamily protein YafD